MISKVVLSKDQSHGKAYGLMVWRGRPKEKVIKIGSPLKKEWKVIKVPDYSVFKGKVDDPKIFMTSQPPPLAESAVLES